jgi:hypothetical protein
MRDRSGLDIKPLTARRFHDLETLFSGAGGSQVRGCWCMFYRRSGRSGAPAGMSRSADESVWFGCASMYDRAGFAEVAWRRPARPVMRKALRATRA